MGTDEKVKANDFYFGLFSGLGITEANNYLYVNTGSSTTQPSGSLQYELADVAKATEQGTPFAENVIVDNYGSMEWLDTNNASVSIPQGCQFFYPADYVEFLDSMYTRSKDGGDSADVSNIVVKSELQPFTDKDTQLLNAIGGTLRQCLCVKETLDFDNTDVVDLGSLTWIYYTSGGVNVFYSISLSNKANGYKMLCTKYKTYNDSDWTNLPNNMVGGNNSNGTIYVKDTAYTSADALKTAMKGVLLAYEKA